MATDAAVAEHLFMSRRSVLDLRAKGVLPPAGSDVDAAREAYIRHMREAAAGRLPTGEKADAEAERNRLTRLQADQIEMKNDQMRGELVPKVEITQAVIGMIEVAKAKLKRVAAKVAPTDPALKARIADAIQDALLDVSAERAFEKPPSDDDSEEGGDH